MGRPERPIEGSGPVPDLARHLRLLRKNAELDLRALAERTGYSISTLSDATAGSQLPTRAVTIAYAQACGGDPEEWGRRWDDAAHFAELPPRTRTHGARPRYAPGPPPLPVTAQTATEFGDCLLRVKIWAGDPSVRTLARRMGNRPFSTVQSLFGRKRLPDRDTVIAFLTACGVHDEAVIGEWIYVWRRLKYDEAGTRRRGSHATSDNGDEPESPPDIRPAGVAAALGVL